uniref:Uncharacterized protein n=1 Tax=Timema bartmani TaxID=61472 RepID=A0A7R9F7G6_9NEOP|nr:unnamed protein product [Timema bartmani]
MSESVETGLVDEIASDALDMFGLSALSSEAIEMVGVPLPGEESAKDPAWLLSMWDENGVCCAQLQLKRKFGMPLIQKGEAFSDTMAQLAAWLFADLGVSYAWDYHRMPSIPEIPTTQKEVFATPLILCAITPQALIGDIISHLDNIDALMVELKARDCGVDLIQPVGVVVTTFFLDKATDLRFHRLVTSQDVEQGLHQLRVTSSPQNVDSMVSRPSMAPNLPPFELVAW